MRSRIKLYTIPGITVYPNTIWRIFGDVNRKLTPLWDHPIRSSGLRDDSHTEGWLLVAEVYGVVSVERQTKQCICDWLECSMIVITK